MWGGEEKKILHSLEPILHPPQFMREGRERKIPNVIIVGWPDLHFPLQTRAHKRFVETRGGEKNVKSAVRWKRMRAIFIKELKSFAFSFVLSERTTTKKKRMKKRDKRNVIIVIFIFAFFCSLHLKYTYPPEEESERRWIKKGKPYIMITKKIRCVYAEQKESNKVKKKKSF